MAGIKPLSEIYKKQGASFLDTLFKMDVTISEKLAGMSFSFEKSAIDGNIYFYKRDQNTPISKIDRVLMRYYENPILFINTLPSIVLDEIPSGWRFGTEFFINSGPVSIIYDNIPRNKLVLTHIIIKNEFGDVEKTVIEKTELDYWSELLNIEKAPIIFQGKLSDEQKTSIIDFINSPYDFLKSEHGTTSFARFIIGTLNPSINKSLLNNSLDETIEGIVFRFGNINGIGESYTAKILDPMFEDITKQNNIQKNSQFPSDIYGITILEIMNFILDKGIENFEFLGETPEDRYISYICSVFNLFIEENGEKYLGLDFQEPAFLVYAESDSNTDLISNEKTIDIINKESSYESLFKLMLSGFRKIKKKPGGFFTQGSIDQFNLLVREISEHINEIIIIEQIIPSFDQFRKKKKIEKPKRIVIEEEVSDEDQEKEEIDNDSDEDNGDDVEIESGEDTSTDNEEDSTETSEPDTEEPIDPEITNKMREILGATEDHIEIKKPEDIGIKVNMVIGEFCPFNMGHYKLILKSYETNNFPTIVFIHPSKTEMLNQDLIEKMMELILEDFSGKIEGFKFIDNNLLSTAFDSIDPQYTPVMLITGEKKSDNYILQLKSLRNEIDIPDEFIIQTAPPWVDSSVLNDVINSKDYMEFKKLVPKSIHLLWEEIIRSYELKKDIYNHEDTI